mgnify:CR=1 FL=1
MVVERKLTSVNEFEQFLAQSDHRLFELIDGEIVEKMPTREHGIIAGNIVTAFNNYLNTREIGIAAVEARHRPPNDLHNDRIPDVSFVADVNKPVEREGAADYMPDLVVEIRSPKDSLKDLSDKASFYMLHGTRIVWLVYPEKRLVEVLTPDSRELLGEGEILSGGDVLPGFSLPVREVFRRV